jgi:tetratricopeptide (TPR) repeat protein
MQFFKEEGNNHYKNQRYSEALYFYQKAIIYADYTFPENAAETEKMEALLQQANCNMALSLIKLDRCEEAKTNLTEALKGKSTAIASKGYYWLAKLHLRKG